MNIEINKDLQPNLFNRIYKMRQIVLIRMIHSILKLSEKSKQTF
jgi:hypothetical protein